MHSQRAPVQVRAVEAGITSAAAGRLAAPGAELVCGYQAMASQHAPSAQLPGRILHAIMTKINSNHNTNNNNNGSNIYNATRVYIVITMFQHFLCVCGANLVLCLLISKRTLAVFSAATTAADRSVLSYQ